MANFLIFFRRWEIGSSERDDSGSIFYTIYIIVIESAIVDTPRGVLNPYVMVDIPNILIN